MSLCRSPLDHGAPAPATVARRTKQLQVVGMIGPASRPRQNVIHLHDAEGEMRVAADANAFLPYRGHGPVAGPPGRWHGACLPILHPIRPLPCSRPSGAAGMGPACRDPVPIEAPAL